MGWLGRGLGQFQSDIGTGYEQNQLWKQRAQTMAMEQARQRIADLKAPLELQELQQRIRQMGMPQFKGITDLPGGGTGAITFEPSTGKAGIQTVVPARVTPESARQYILGEKEKLPENEKFYADSLLTQISTLGADPAKAVDAMQQFIGRRAERPLAGDEPLGARVPQMNEMIRARYQAQNPGKNVPAYFQLPANATQKDFDNLDKVLQQMEVAASKDQPVKLSPDALEAMAGIFIRTGQLPALGLGGVGVREQIFNRAGEILSGKGKPYAGTGDPLVNAGAAFKALTGAFNLLTRQRAAVGAFENTALKNLEMFEGVAKGVVDTGSPWINKPLRAIEVGALGKSDLVAYNTARQVALTEISRVINNPNLVGVLSDEARGEVGALIGQDATLKMVYDAADILKKDMANRRGGLDKEIAELRAQMTPPSPGPGAGAPGGAVDQPPAGAKVRDYSQVGPQ